MSEGDNIEAGVPFVRAAVAAEMETAIKLRGIDPTAIFETAQIERKDIDALYPLIRVDQLTHLFELAAVGTKCAHLALEVASDLDLTRWGVFGYAILNSPTAGKALANLCAFFRSFQTGAHMDYVSYPDSFGIQYSIWHRSVRYKNQDAEHMVASIRGMISRLLLRSIDPVAVYFEHEPLSPLAIYQNYLGAKPDFGMQTNAIFFPKGLEDTAVSNADAQLLLILMRHIQDLQLDLPQEGNLTDSVKHHIRYLLPTGACSLSRIAQYLGVETRTLQRRLSKNNLSYRQLLDEVRAELSMKYLRDPAMTLSEISFLVGFNDVSAFLKSFKKWTGYTPSHFRELDRKEPVRIA